VILHNKEYHKHVTSSTGNSIRTTDFLSSPPLLRYVDAAQEGDSVTGGGRDKSSKEL
jgi:hypothetical protein